MQALLDVNVLLALFDSEHTHHGATLHWWASQGRTNWASCPLTENGFLRIISSPSYSRPVSLADARLLLLAQIAHGGHAFWPDDVSIADAAIFDHGRLLGTKQITDVYLLAIAVKNGGQLVTFDRSISIRAVRGASPENLLVL